MVWPIELDLQEVFLTGTEHYGGIAKTFIHKVGLKEGSDGNMLLSSAKRVLDLLLSCLESFMIVLDDMHEMA